MSIFFIPAKFQELKSESQKCISLISIFFHFSKYFHLRWFARFDFILMNPFCNELLIYYTIQRLTYSSREFSMDFKHAWLHQMSTSKVLILYRICYMNLMGIGHRIFNRVRIPSWLLFIMAQQFDGKLWTEGFNMISWVATKTYLMT